MKKFICTAILMLMCATTVCAAQDSTLQHSEQQLLQLQEQQGFDTDEVLSGGVLGFFELAFETAKSEFAQPLKLFLTVIVILLASSVARGISQTQDGVPKTLDTVLTIVFFVVLLVPVLSMQSTLVEAVTDCKDFIASFTMVFVSLLMAGGQVGTATVATAFFSGSFYLLSEVLSYIVIPLAGIYLALRSTALCVTTIEFKSIAELVRKAARYIMLALATVFTGILGMQSIISGAADSVAIKTGKFLVGSGVPIIGSVVQDALSAVLGGISSLKATAGITAVIAVFVMFAPLLVQCVLYSVVFAVSAAAAEISGSDKTMKLMQAAGVAMEIYFSSIVLLFFIITVSVITLMLTGGGM